MDADTRLDARLLVGGYHEVLVRERLARPRPMVQVKHPPSLALEVPRTREYPGPVLPRLDGIFVEPPPDSGATDLGNETLSHALGGDVPCCVSRHRNAATPRELTCGCLYGHYDRRGGKRADARLSARPAGLRRAAQRSGSFTCLPPVAAGADGR